MGQAPLVSVIMPVYNAGTLLHAAAASVLRQTMPDLELLLIDDGSTDGSTAVCRTLAEADHRVRVFTQPNSGICAARNRGLSEMHGAWFTFCDDDDEMEPDALHTLLALAQGTGAPLVRGGYRLLRQNAAGTPVELPHTPGTAMTIECPAGENYLRFLQASGPQFVWNALYRADVFAALRFDGRCRRGLEDFLFNAAAYQTAKTAAYTPAVTYIHTERTGSASACADPAAVQARLDTLPLWVQAEHATASAWCTPEQLPAVWSVRQAEFVTFVMHQTRDGRLLPAQTAAAWRALRRALAQYPRRCPDFLCAARYGKKRGAALLLFRIHLQGLYACLPNREGKLLQ